MSRTPTPVDAPNGTSLSLSLPCRARVLTLPISPNYFGGVTELAYRLYSRGEISKWRKAVKDREASGTGANKSGEAQGDQRDADEHRNHMAMRDFYEPAKWRGEAEE